MNTNRHRFEAAFPLCLLLAAGGLRTAAANPLSEKDAGATRGGVSLNLQAKPGRAAPDDAARRDTKVENVDGGVTALSQLRGNVTVLILSGKGSADAGTALMREITLGAAQERELTYALVADLRDAPGFFRGTIRGKVKDKMLKQRQATQDDFKRAGAVYEARHTPLILLDWKGAVAKAFSLQGSLDAAYRVLVLDKAGNIAFQYAQPNLKKGEKSLNAPILKAIKETLARK